MKVKKFLSFLLSIVLVCCTLIPCINVFAERNPYPTSQTISGVTTIPCTWYAWQQAYEKTGVVMPNWGNAGNWYTNARNAGYPVGSVAKPDSIAVWSGDTYGHVSYVVSVNGSKMTVNEGGMSGTSNGILTGNLVNSIVGQQKGNGSTKILVGFIYLTESVTQNISVSFTNNEIQKYDNNAIVDYKISKPSGYAVTEIGVKIREDGKSYSNDRTHKQTPAKSDYNTWTSVPISWDFKSELGWTLKHATKYYCQYYAKIGGKDYWSDEFSFTTTGSHSYGSWVTTNSPTCTATGTAKRTCSCGKYETKTLNATGHNWSSSFTVDKQATCISKGSKSRHCKNCNAKTDITELPITVHDIYEAGKISNATCTESAKIKYICGVCEEVFIVNDPDNNPAFGHKFSNACDKTCNTCGVKRAIKHSYTTNRVKATLTKNGKIEYKCKVCGYIASTSKVVKKIKTIKLSNTVYSYNGKVKTPGVIIKDSAGKSLKKNTDYTVSYSKGRKNVGTYKVTIKFKGKYSGAKTLTFKINPPKTTVNKLTAAKKSLTITVSKKTSQVSGYKIQYSTSKNFKSYKTKTLTSYKKTSTTLSKLSAKKTYYVRVRTYKTVNGKKYYSTWSTIKYKKTK